MRDTCRHVFFAGAILVLTLGALSVSRAQTGGGASGGVGGIPGTGTFGGATDPSAIQFSEGFALIPMITVAERYDSNVFFVPKTPGVDRSDVVTTIVPQVRGLYAGSLGTANATVGAIGESYAKNSGLNYFGANAGASLDLSRLVGHLREGSRLIVSDTYSYTPQPPAFLTGDHEGGAPNPLLTGLQAGRVNTQSNSFNTSFAVPLTRTVNLTGSYGKGFIKFGKSEVTQIGALLDQNYETYSAGLLAKLSPRDSVSLNFINSKYDSGDQGSFSATGGTIGWSHQFTPTIMLTSAAGVQLIDGTYASQGPTSSTVGSQVSAASSSTIAPNGSLALFWKGNTTTMTMLYSIGITPSFLFESQPLLTHVTSFALTQQMGSPQLLSVVSLNYGHGSQFGSSSSAASAVAFTSYAGSAGLTYKFTPTTFLSGGYSYSNSDQVFGAQGFRFDRHVVQLNLTHAFY